MAREKINNKYKLLPEHIKNLIQEKNTTRCTDHEIAELNT